MDKRIIIDEIRRIAENNDGNALGREWFFAEIGIKESDWYGKHWVKWSEAAIEATYSPNVIKGSLHYYYRESFLAKK